MRTEQRPLRFGAIILIEICYVFFFSQSQLQQNGVPSSAVPRNPLHKWIVGHGAVNEVQFAPHTANRLNRTATATTLSETMKSYSLSVCSISSPNV